MALLERCCMLFWRTLIIRTIGRRSATSIAKSGPNGRWVLSATPPTLDRIRLWPKEEELLRTLATEKAQGASRGCSAFTPTTHPVLRRLETIIRQAGYRVKVLDADKVPTRNRRKWIAKNAKGIDVMISHPQPVQTGLTLLDAARKTFNFPSLLFYETGYNPYVLRQAARRSWRIGQTLPCRVYFFHYRGDPPGQGDGPDGPEDRRLAGIEGQFSCEDLPQCAPTAAACRWSLLDRWSRTSTLATPRGPGRSSARSWPVTHWTPPFRHRRPTVWWSLPGSGH